MDANKTLLTHTLTCTAAYWLNLRGFNIVEPEVSFSGSDPTKYMIADLVGYCSPNSTEKEKLGLLVRNKNSRYNWQKISIIQGFEQPLIALMEVKQTRADFLKDLTTKFIETYAHLNYVVYPYKLIKPEELPTGWWGLECSTNGSRVQKLHRGQAIQLTTEEIKDWIVAICGRRYNRETYCWTHDLYNEIYEKETPKAAIGRLLMLIDKIDARLDGRLQNGALTREIECLVKKIYLHPTLRKKAQALDDKIQQLREKLNEQIPSVR